MQTRKASRKAQLKFAEAHGRTSLQSFEARKAIVGKDARSSILGRRACRGLK